jgi:hypothetical protein
MADAKDQYQLSKFTKKSRARGHLGRTHTRQSKEIGSTERFYLMVSVNKMTPR